MAAVPLPLAVRLFAWFACALALIAAFRSGWLDTVGVAIDVEHEPDIVLRYPRRTVHCIGARTSSAQEPSA